ncbi:hypothetical protein SO802_006616 [Lithocarpus litseifolius]|uniref:RNase H type-1 domain-containing protein n=1 Tax=Lithocarpus litseifolius TaxID=425828 RepID=A0AAW2DLH1_9ROSI
MKTTALPYSRIYQDMRERLQEYISAQDSSITMPINSLHVQWEPPPWPFFKVNYDGALFQEIQQAGIGVMIRDSGGQKWGLIKWSLKGTLKQLQTPSIWTHCLASFGHIVDDAKVLATNFVFSFFSHAKRKANAVADRLAKLAKHFPSPCFLPDDIPSDVLHFVIADRLSVV